MSAPSPHSESSLARVRQSLVAHFGVDRRALAALRIALGALLLLDLVLRARDLVSFYSDLGVLPRSALARNYPSYSAVSIHAISGEVWVQVVLFLVAGAFAAALLVGYRTRLATAGSLVLLVSLHARNPMILNAGDVLFRRLLFWSIFLPLGSRWAIESDGENEVGEWVDSVATAAILVQVVLVYFTNIAFKLQTYAWIRGEAIQYVFSLNEFTVGIAPFVAQYPTLLEVTALAWFALLCSSPLLLVLTGWHRTALASLFAAGHVGMLVTMDLGIFPLVSLAALLPFVTPPVWDRLGLPEGGTLGRLADRAPSTPTWSPSLPGESQLTTVRSLLLAVLLVTMLVLNAFAVGVVDPPESVPEAAEDRSWNMFGNPPQSEIWYVAEATLESGREVTGHVSDRWWGGPTTGNGRYPRARWRKFKTKLTRSGDEQLPTLLAADVCRRWSASDDESVRSVRLTRVHDRVNLTGPDPRESSTVVRHDC